MTMPEAAPSHISRRMSLVLGLLVASILINYVDRGNLSVAAPMLKDELGLSPQKLGTLLSSFFWTYASMQLVSGWLVDRFDPRLIMGLGFLLWSAATAATGFVHIFAALLIARLVLGVGESVAYPSYAKIFSRYFPERRHGIANALITSGLLLGPGVGLLTGGLLMARFGWRPFFIALGFGSMLWLPLWFSAMPRERRQVAPTKDDSLTLGQFVCLRQAWGACGGHFAANYLNYFLITWLPFYLVKERGFSLQNTGKLGAFAYLMGAIASSFCGWFSDFLIHRGHNPSRVRKAFAGGGMLGAAFFLVLILVGGHTVSAVMLVMMAIFFGVTGSHIFVIAQTLAGPEAAGRWTGMQNFAGNFAGPVAPFVTGFVLQRTGTFVAPIMITAVVLVFGAICWLIVLKRAEQIDWPSLNAARTGASRAVTVIE